MACVSAAIAVEPRSLFSLLPFEEGWTEWAMTGRGSEITGRITRGWCNWTGVSVWENGSWLTFSKLPIGLAVAAAAIAALDRGVNSGAPGFSLDPYKKEVIRNCQKNSYDNDSLAASIPLSCGPMASLPLHSVPYHSQPYRSSHPQFVAIQ